MEKVTLSMSELNREYILKQIIEGKLTGIGGRGDGLYHPRVCRGYEP